MAIVVTRKKRPSNPAKKLGQPVPPIPQLRKQAHESLDSLMTAALTDDHGLYQLALMNLTDAVALIRFSEPKELEDFGG